MVEVETSSSEGAIGCDLPRVQYRMGRCPLPSAKSSICGNQHHGCFGDPFISDL